MATVTLETDFFFRKTLVGFVPVDSLEEGFDMVVAFEKSRDSWHFLDAFFKASNLFFLGSWQDLN
ncbi:Uncharacterised protein [Mycobacterium tuberculosis]|nr:Uncharacterised protein [Mycobacterium tuberculosis]CKV71585.1 Uncharacterised protein [Mycobacterium tuberculosis]